MATRSNNYTQPRPKKIQTNVTIPDISVVEKVDRLYERFLLSDQVERGWDAIPKKIVSVTTGNGTHDNALVIPLVSNNLSDAIPIWEQTTHRQLFLDNAGSPGIVEGTQRAIPIVRPTNPETGQPRKAYLNAVAYAAYDYNEILPKHNFEAMKSFNYFDDALMPETAPNSFGSYPGLIIGMLDYAGRRIYPYDPDTSTASYPIALGEDVNANQLQRARKLAAMALLDQSAPRASIVNGMLPSDWMKNMFKIEIGGHNGVGYTGGSVTAQQSIYKVAQQSDLYFDDLLFPAANNEINVEIPNTINWLTVDVWGVAWFHAVKRALDAGDWLNSERGLTTIEPPYLTIVNMPLKVQIDIRYV